MNKFLTILACAIAASCLTATSFAQAAGPQGGGVQSGGTDQKGKDGAKHAHGPIARKLLKDLNLTADQQKKVKELMKKYAEEAKANQTYDAKPDRKAMKAKREQFLKDLNAILTPEQQTKLKEEMAKGKKGIKG